MSRKDETKSQLSGSDRGQWQDVLGAPEQPQTYKRRTFLITEPINDRIQQLVDDYNLPVNDLVRWMLETMLDEVESGQRELPLEQEVVHRIKRD